VGHLVKWLVIVKLLLHYGVVPDPFWLKLGCCATIARRYFLDTPTQRFDTNDGDAAELNSAPILQSTSILVPPVPTVHWKRPSNLVTHHDGCNIYIDLYRLFVHTITPHHCLFFVIGFLLFSTTQGNRAADVWEYMGPTTSTHNDDLSHFPIILL
jgi:hypothetical protein